MVEVAQMTASTVLIIWGVLGVAYVFTWILVYLNGPKIRSALKKEIRDILKEDPPRILKDPSKFTKRR
jgi:hypothetical protein